MWWKLLIFVVMSVMIVASFLTAAPQQMLGEKSRIFYYHVPQAWVCVLAFLVSMIYSIRYLKSRKPEFDDGALEAARLGFIFCVLATITGSIFANAAWGSFWNWDPRQTSIFILLLIYGAYFALRGAIEYEEKRAALSAVYSIFAFLTVPFLVFVLPRMVESLHPDDSILDENLRITMGPTVRMIFFSALGLFTVLFFWMLNIGKRVARLHRAQIESEA